MGRFSRRPLALMATALLALMALLLALPLASPAAGSSPPGPRLVVEAPPALHQAAARVRAIEPSAFAEVMSLVGLADPGAPILVRLEPEGAGPARSVPPWIAGFAVPAIDTIVLFPARAPSYPDSSLDDLLRHEVAHVLTSRAAGGRSLPRWFDEGLAMIAGGTWGADDHARFLLELMVDPGVPLGGLDGRFAGSQRQVAGAYAVAGAFVREQVQRHGAGAPGRILAAVATGAPFPEAFRIGTGTALDVAETEFWRRHSLQRWLPLATSSTTLWLGITLLVLVAARRRHRRAAALRARWEQEDSATQQTLDGDDAAASGPQNPARGT
jgi:hypothetical protein